MQMIVELPSSDSSGDCDDDGVGYGIGMLII